MINEPVILKEECRTHNHGHFKRLSWTAVFVGALVGVGLGFLLNLFCIAIGVSAFTLNSTGASALAIGGLIALLIGVVASMLVAGYAAGFLGRMYCPKRNMGILYGFSTWTVALILSALVAIPLSHYTAAYVDALEGKSLVITQNDKVDIKANVDQNPSSPRDNQTAKTVDVTPGHLATGAFILFVMFFVGALSSCIGACWGMTCCRED